MILTPFSHSQCSRKGIFSVKKMNEESIRRRIAAAEAKLIFIVKRQQAVIVKRVARKVISF